ncbi:hypothetical protein AJ79_07527 [Helicocarpus griseus UAMH5409]|uniref:F-box domain-containing protein n=1 Tax=Helicocarpus griseus UAMH5409 TaxID=1447875 RepID=A0A2B7X258_9EURO|nr:hypothetical protein AJ79_07527 [Helicocarpus griseus UAMH5409]
MFFAPRQNRHQTGIQLTRYRGKYYSQEIQPTSTIIQETLSSIPTDSVQYILWLKKQRQQYARKEKQLEASIFTLVDTSQSRDTTFIKGKLQEAELCDLPSPLFPRQLAHPLLLTIDLDLQILSTAAGAHFRLNNLPRDRDKFSSEASNAVLHWSTLHTAVKQSIALPWRTPTDLEYDCDNYRSNYRAVPLSTDKWLSPGFGFYGSFFELAFSVFKAAYSENISRECIRWSPNDYIFREFAYAVVSFASGRVFFRIESSPYRDVEKYKISWPPELGVECHLSNQVAGSAPEESIYWFDNVLINLVPDIPKQRHIYIDKTVNFGIKQGKSCFQAILLSLSSVVLLDVKVENGIRTVKHTDRLDLFADYMAPSASPQSPPSHAFANLQISTPQQPTSGSATSLYRKNETFIALSNFFTAATLRHLKPQSRDTKGRLPSELYYMILDCTDSATFLACAKVSHLFRSYCLSKLRLYEKNGDMGIRKSSLVDNYTHQITKVLPSRCLTVQNRVSGKIVDWSPCKEQGPPRIPGQRELLCLVPVFGESDRLSESSRAMCVFENIENPTSPQNDF